jgi:pyruvate,orthophosphate dikinase
MDWADATRRLKVRTNADTPHDAQQAREFGAQGIGLCRTEHMFFGEDRIMKMREMILADTVEARRAALAKMKPMQQADFEGIFRAMDGLPVTIRLLDPPLHEFLPQAEEDMKFLAGEMKVPFEAVKRKTESLHEMNPMLGHRGCRLGHHVPRDVRDAGRGDHRRRGGREEGRRRRAPGDHDPAGGHASRAGRFCAR